MTGLFRNHRFAAVAAAAICLFAMVTLTADRSSAFTLIERQYAFDPVEITVDQAAHVVVNNTFSSQQIHITINFADALTGAPIGMPAQADLPPGHGTLTVLPAVQVSTNPLGTRAIIAVLKVSPAQGAVALVPGTIQITGSLNVVDTNTGHVSVSRGFGIVPGF
jgi:hypothetical protein